jgi:hypothetical protein
MPGLIDSTAMSDQRIRMYARLPTHPAVVRTLVLYIKYEFSCVQVAVGSALDYVECACG